MRWAHFNPKTKTIPEDPLCHILSERNLKMWHISEIPSVAFCCPCPSCILSPGWCSDQIVLRQATLIRNPRVSSDRFLLWRRNAKPFFRGKSRQETVATDAKTFLFLCLNVSKFHQMATGYDLQITSHSPHKWIRYTSPIFCCKNI